jgi:type III restriction enzyme
MAKRATATSASLDFAFFNFLWEFYRGNRGTIRTHYKELTRKFLDFNNPDKNPKAFLRQPQYEALEMYIFLKEFMDNAKVEEVFKAWFEKTGRFAGRKEGGIIGESRQGDLLDRGTQDQYKTVFAAMRKNSRVYPNYIFALTMGTGKTILMATCIFYEFLLGNKFEKDARYCHNALVFAPDKTVLQSLKEIESFDLDRVVPPEYVNFLTTHLRFHYLEEAGTSLSTLDRSRFNIVVSNTQKIILKRQRKEKTPMDQLFGATANTVAANDEPRCRRPVRIPLRHMIHHPLPELYRMRLSHH